VSVEPGRYAIVAALFNGVVVERLLDGAKDCLVKDGVTDVSVTWVPGAFELPLTAQKLASSGRIDAVICLGAVIRGETPHFDMVAGQAARGLMDVGLRTGLPVIFGVLTTDTLEQAMERAGGLHGNKGWDAALAAIEMVGVMRQLGV
jgi:6,7-dimethyl-8-ribityllumazine synthase